MKVLACPLPGVLVLEPELFEDERGFLYESYNARVLAERARTRSGFVQQNHLRSSRNVLRGLHSQLLRPQGKLVRATAGQIYVAVDLRRSSPGFGRWTAQMLSAENHRMLWIPPGFAHAFLVVSEHAEVQYKSTEYWEPGHERVILWNDPELGIPWPLAGSPILSEKDRSGVPLREAEVFP